MCASSARLGTRTAVAAPKTSKGTAAAPGRVAFEGLAQFALPLSVIGIQPARTFVVAPRRE
jgi:hypothetical protein